MVVSRFSRGDKPPDMTTVTESLITTGAAVACAWVGTATGAVVGAAAGAVVGAAAGAVVGAAAGAVVGAAGRRRCGSRRRGRRSGRRCLLIVPVAAARSCEQRKCDKENNKS